MKTAETLHILCWAIYRTKPLNSELTTSDELKRCFTRSSESSKVQVQGEPLFRLINATQASLCMKPAAHELPGCLLRSQSSRGLVSFLQQ